MIKKIIILSFLLLALISPCWATDYSQDANCMGYWPMEGGLSANGDDETDLSGEGGTLTEDNGDMPNSATKKFGTYSRDFTRSDNEQLTHADGNSTDISGATDLSIVCWYYRESDSADDEYLVVKYKTGSTTSRQYYLEIENTDKIKFAVYEPTGNFDDGHVVEGDTVVGTGAWIHVAGVYNQTDLRVYKEGILDCTPVAYTGSIHNSSSAFEVGNGRARIEGIDGLLDDVAIFDRALTAEEVLDIKNNGVQGTVSAAKPQLILITE